MKDLQGSKKPFNFLKWPQKSRWKKCYWCLSYPWQLLFLLTIPNVHRHCSRKLYILSFAMSVCWLGVLTYLFTWCLTIIGKALHFATISILALKTNFTFKGFYLFVPETLMRLIVLAVGISLPEAICGVIVSRKGK